ncbi:signal peptide peptidase SppA [Rhodopila sp.]|uniref:signal peptide peptidase SppA n=1 Tax=Rhodopila sp. TaxID=2480087 RepID=UPI002BEF4E90|nr:signal peptide peptidase SppA [Rhodopila sp.]HVZ10097.1 signal peptide peptidase SppA [Rhodopila sp.]
MIALIIAVGAGLHAGGWRFGSAHVARVTVKGIITDDRKVTEAIAKLAEDDSVKAVILSVDSPGGSVAGGEGLYSAIRRVAGKKPVVTVMGGLAASAGYMISAPTTRIFARDSTLTGSIGVLLQTGEMSGLLSKVGISATTIKSGPLKDEPNYFEPLTPAAKTMLQGLIDDMYDQFVTIVATGRHMDPAKVREIADGRPYTGRQALKLGLVDEIGGEPEARAWLSTERGVPVSLPVDDVTPDDKSRWSIAGQFGPLFDEFWKTLVSQSVSLDAPWAIWQRPGH